MWDFFQQHSLDCKTTDVADDPQEMGINFKMYPNPTDDHFTINLPDPMKEFTVTIYNTGGKQIIKSKNQTNYDLSAQPAGIYYVSIQTGHKKESRKIIRKE